MKFTHAIVARVPETYSSTSSENSHINLEKAKSQHSLFVEAIRGMGVDVLELPPEESSPYSVYTRDLAIAHNGLALICRPDLKNSRSSDIKMVKNVLRKELNHTVMEMKNEKGLLNGSDVLFTGKEFFIGLTSSTNTEGALAVANTWPEYPCTPIKVDGDGKNLRDFIHMIGSDVFCVNGNCTESQSLLRRIEREATYRYKILTLSDESTSDCLYVNGTLFYRGIVDESAVTNGNGHHLSSDELKSKIDFPHKAIDISEFLKCLRQRSSLSSLIILLRKTKIVKKL